MLLDQSDDLIDEQACKTGGSRFNYNFAGMLAATHPADPDQRRDYLNSVLGEKCGYSA